jgi:hypothetical protein
MSATTSTRTPATSSTGKASSGFTEEERAAMREYAKEVKAADKAWVAALVRRP